MLELGHRDFLLSRQYFSRVFLPAAPGFFVGARSDIGMSVQSWLRFPLFPSCRAQTRVGVLGHAENSLPTEFGGWMLIELSDVLQGVKPNSTRTIDGGWATSLSREAKVCRKS